MKVTSAEIAKYLQLLDETPRRIAAASEGYAAEALQTRPDSKSWSANDIVAHLRACVDVWGKEIRAMLAEDNPTWRYLSPRTWLRKTDYAELSFHESFAVFVEERQELLELLTDLPFEDWSRLAVVKQGDKEREQTVFHRVRQMAMHEETHCKQIEDLLQQEEI